MRKAILAAFCFLAMCFLNGCQMLGYKVVKTGLTEDARYTGTVSLLRVDDGWRGKFDNKGQEIERGFYDLGEGFNNRAPRYVPVRFKSDIAGMDNSDRIVTDDDYIVISLNSTFIKYFRELGGTGRKGEIAVVVSFDAGEDAVESVLLFASQGQTLSSFFPLDDWPVIGPLQMKSDFLRVRFVMIEIDQHENEKTKNIIKFLSQTASIAKPGLSGLFAIAEPVVNQLVALNSDDVVLDYRFSLRKTGKGESVHQTPLLYGKYILMLQEDRLLGEDVIKTTPLAVTPIDITKMRYDLYTDRVQKVYNYESSECGTTPIGWTSLYYSKECEGLELTSLCPPPTDCEEPKIADINSDKAVQIRQEKFGYMYPVIDPYCKYNRDVNALEAALIEACRTKAYFGSNLGAEIREKCKGYQISEGRYGFEYPVTQYPDAFLIATQYPLHTHLVFSIERTTGSETAFHDQFQTYAEYMKSLLSEVPNFDDLTQTLSAATTQYKKKKAVLANLKDMPNDELMERVCLLWSEGLNNGENNPNVFVSSVMIYNELFHVTGKIFTSVENVEDYILSSGCTVDKEGKDKCSCIEAVKTVINNRNADDAAAGDDQTNKPTDEPEASRNLEEQSPPMEGNDVTAVQQALAAAGFPVEGEKGIYGPTTNSAVRLLQKSKGLTVDGIVGPKTREVLGL